MFKLQRLEITGFKSFADYTELIFTGDGITAVVGPNGCGKSNVSDAISWVLGEQRVKHLRGGEMKDVIFQGSRNRKPSGMAEVVLHMVRDETVEVDGDIEDIDSTLEQIDDQSVELPMDSKTEEQTIPVQADGLTAANQDVEQNRDIESESGEDVEPATTLEHSEVNGLAPTRTPGKRHWRKSRRALEFSPGESVAVTRRLYRSGESEYLLNNRVCRLRDIQDLFSGTGLSGAHYAIVEQGRIGQILSAKPMDRRTLIEEAAGITKFRVRQRAAETRLDSARGNLSRVSDIISEIDRQVNSLRRQAGKARRYRVLRTELRDLLRNVYVAEDNALSALLENTRVELEELTNLESSLAAELAVREKEVRGSTQAARSLEEDLSVARGIAAEAALNRDRRQREKSYQQEQAESLDRRRVEVTAEIEQLRLRLANVDEECERLREIDTELRLASEESAERLRNAEAAYAVRVAEVREAETFIDRSRSELLTHTAVSERLSEIARQLESTLERLALQAEGLSREGERAAAVFADRANENAELGDEIEMARGRLEELRTERDQSLQTAVEAREYSASAARELNRVREETSKLRHRLDSLADLDIQRAHFSQAVQKLMGTGDSAAKFHIQGTLADKLRVDAQWERAVEGIFGSALQTLLTPSPEDAIRASEWLRANDAGRATFLVLGLQGASGIEDFGSKNAAGVGLATEGLETVRITDVLGAPSEVENDCVFSFRKVE